MATHQRSIVAKADCQGRWIPIRLFKTLDDRYALMLLSGFEIKFEMSATITQLLSEFTIKSVFISCEMGEADR
ncbi:MAG: hypothetical protein WKF73_14030 [Nocardioidaceae bacterium]